MRRLRDASGRRRTAEEDNSREAFHATCRLYARLRERAAENPAFLPRNLRRDFPRPPPSHRFPLVRYTSREPGVAWTRDVPRLRCLWCAAAVPRFWNPTELLHHLRTCHGTLAYALHAGPARASPVVVSMRLLRGEEGALATAIDRFHMYDMEEVFVNRKKYPRYLRHSTCPPDAKREYARIAAAEATDDAQQSQDAQQQQQQQQQQPTGRANRRRTATKKKRKTIGKPSFPSVQQAVEDERLFHSILQAPLCVESYGEGYDSDDDAEEEKKWRLQLMDTEVEEFVDTTPVEKLFMNLWNQFMVTEFVARADRHVAPACKTFVNKYRTTLIRLNLEATFLRHLTELGRRGLLDADTIYDAFKVLGNRDMGGAAGEAAETRFLFAERFRKLEARRRRAEQAEGDAAAANGIKVE